MRRNPRKIDDGGLYRLLVEEGCTQQQAAEHFGVSEAAISKRVRLLGIELNRHVGLERAKDVADRGLNVFDQLEAINRTICEELNWAVEEARKPGTDRKGFEQTIIDLTSEVRKQLRFQKEILESLYNIEGVRKFQESVLEAINEVSPETRIRIVEKLHERRALRRSVEHIESGW